MKESNHKWALDASIAEPLYSEDVYDEESAD